MKVKLYLFDNKLKKEIAYKDNEAEIHNDDLYSLIQFLDRRIIIFPNDKRYNIILEIKNLDNSYKTRFYSLREFWYFILGMERMYELIIKDDIL